VAAEVLGGRRSPGWLVTGPWLLGGGGSVGVFGCDVEEGGVRGTVAAVAAEQVFVASARPVVRGERVRVWARAECVAYEALVEARACGDAGLVENARRAWSETWRRGPGGRRPRRARRGGPSL
jgi:hypothetical protein